MLVTIISLSPMMNSAFAQSENFIVITETDFYDDRCLTMTGKVKNIIPYTPVTLQVFGPTGNLVEIRQLDVGADKLFNANFVPTSNSWKIEGDYMVNLAYGIHDFKYLLYTSESKSNVVVGSSTIYKFEEKKYFYEDIEGTMKNVSIKDEGNSISYELDKTHTPCDGKTYDHSIGFQNYLVIDDSKEKSEFFVLINNTQTPYQLFVTDKGTTTVITFDVPFGHQFVDITATKIIPEFGMLAMLILAVSVIVVILTFRVKSFQNILIH